MKNNDSKEAGEESMRINIFFNFRSGIFGGGNQFLKTLKTEFVKQGIYEESPEKAEIILFNSHHQLADVLKIKHKNPEKVMIHRLGPVFHYHRGWRWKKYDKAIIKFTNKISDGVIFQSDWSLQQAFELGFDKAIPHRVVYNAVNPSIFNQNNKKPFNPKEKVKLAAMSWSANQKKGFAIYQYLDENLNFSKYEMTFIGCSPIKFKRIKTIQLIPSEKVAQILKQNDIFIFAGQFEACSNALIEALSSGLPSVALNSGSNAELVRQGGEMFMSQSDVIEKIDKVAHNYINYHSSIQEFSIRQKAGSYYDFSSKIQPKKAGFLAKFQLFKLKLMSLEHKILKGL